MVVVRPHSLWVQHLAQIAVPQNALVLVVNLRVCELNLKLVIVFKPLQRQTEYIARRHHYFLLQLHHAVHLLPSEQPHRRRLVILEDGVAFKVDHGLVFVPDDPHAAVVRLQFEPENTYLVQRYMLYLWVPFDLKIKVQLSVLDLFRLERRQQVPYMVINVLALIQRSVVLRNPELRV